MSNIVWTTLPRGIDAHGYLSCSIIVSPRLDTYDTIAPTVFSYWPNIMTIAPVVYVEPLGVYTPAIRTSPDPDLRLWYKVFPSTSPVKKYDFANEDNSGRAMWSYSIEAVTAFIE